MKWTRNRRANAEMCFVVFLILIAAEFTYLLIRFFHEATAVNVIGR